MHCSFQSTQRDKGDSKQANSLSSVAISILLLLYYISFFFFPWFGWRWSTVRKREELYDEAKLPHRLRKQGAIAVRAEPMNPDGASYLKNENIHNPATRVNDH